MFILILAKVLIGMTTNAFLTAFLFFNAIYNLNAVAVSRTSDHIIFNQHCFLNM